MVKRIQTRIVLGSRETPRFVTEDFFAAMHCTTSVFQYDFTLRPTTIEYKIPRFMVVERNEIFPEYSIHISDAVEIPMCNKRKILLCDTYKHKTAKSNFDRFRVYTEEYDDAYYLLVPHAHYFDTYIYKDWTVRHLIYDNVYWDIHFKQVYLDPHDTQNIVWFFNRPKYQIELIARHDFRNKPNKLKEAVMTMIPRSLR